MSITAHLDLSLSCLLFIIICKHKKPSLPGNSLSLSSHDHSDLDSTNTFGEIHMMMYSANNVGGMQTTLSGTENLNWVQNPEDTGIGNSFNKNNETEIQIAIPMPPGYGHGPLWSVDPVTGEPTRLCSGGIQYPPHRMLTQANGPPHSPPRYQMWVAFEHLPEDVTVPLKMLTEWPNAYLQSNLPEADCTAQAAAANLVRSECLIDIKFLEGILQQQWFSFC